MNGFQKKLCLILVLGFFTSTVVAQPDLDKKGIKKMGQSFSKKGWVGKRKKSVQFHDYDSEYIVFRPEVVNEKDESLRVSGDLEYVSKNHPLHGGGNDEAEITMIYSPSGELTEISMLIKWKRKTRYRRTWKKEDFESDWAAGSLAGWESVFLKDSGDVFDELVHIDKHEGRYYLREVIVRYAKAVHENVSAG